MLDAVFVPPSWRAMLLRLPDGDAVLAGKYLCIVRAHGEVTVVTIALLGCKGLGPVAGDFGGHDLDWG